MRLWLKANRYNIIFVGLCIYYTGKMLWDYLLPNILELISLLILGFGIIRFLAEDMKETHRFYIVCCYAVMSLYIFFNAFFQDSNLQFNRCIYEYLFYSGLVFSLAYYLKRVDLKACSRIINYWGLLIAILSWVEYIRKSYLIGSFSATIREAGIYSFRAAVFTRSYLSHGVVLGFFALFSFYIFINERTHTHLFTALFIWLSILTTSSRGPLVSTFIALMICYIAVTKFEKSSTIKLYLTLSVIGVMVFLLITGTFTTGNDTIDYFLYRIRKIVDWQSDGGNLGRIKFWSRAIEWFEESPIVGIGPSKTGSWGTGSLGVTESGVLKHLCELGIIGFIAYYHFILTVFKSGYRKLKVQSNQCQLNNGVLYLGLFTLVFINNFTLQSTEEITVNFIYCIALGGMLL